MAIFRRLWNALLRAAYELRYLLDHIAILRCKGWPRWSSLALKLAI
ncbi:hypothetical protein CH06BL_09700 [Chromobacterium haemolyticum]|nr:hypothetical protein CH06BL_09700 [Chromobacterium haemolyticum]